MKNFLAGLCVVLSLSLSGRLLAQSSQELAVFAGGCFWCLQPPFDKLKERGVLKTRVGYTGGAKENPSYEEVSKGKSGHVEVMEVVFDPSRISYSELLTTFWKNIDPYDASGQFCDKGPQYMSGVYYASDKQKEAFDKSLAALSKEGVDLKKLVTKPLKLGKFWPAEDYHQDYYLKNPIRYKYYRTSCGRDRRLQEIWGKKTL